MLHFFKEKGWANKSREVTSPTTTSFNYINNDRITILLEKQVNNNIPMTTQQQEPESLRIGNNGPSNLTASLTDVTDRFTHLSSLSSSSNNNNITIIDHEPNHPTATIPPSSTNTIMTTQKASLDRTKSLSSIIHDAARIMDWDGVVQLCQLYPSCASYNSDGFTALHHACTRRCSSPSVFYHLIQAYPQALLEADGDKGWLPIHHACRFKAPKEAIRLLLYSFPERGGESVKRRCKDKGRTPLYYAIRYEAPEGVVPLLLGCMDREDILDGDKEGNSALWLIWDQWATSFEGKRIMKFYSSKLVSCETIEDFLKIKYNSPLNGKALERWNEANMLLKSAFYFQLDNNNNCNSGGGVGGNDDQVVNQINKKLKNSNMESEEGREGGGENGVAGRERKWRVLHATASIKCHPTLFMMACVLHPEQALEMDENDLYYQPNSNRNHSCSSSSSAKTTTACATTKKSNSQNANDSTQPTKYTALHLAAKSSHLPGATNHILQTLFKLYPEAISIPNPADHALPLHYACGNESLKHYLHDGIKFLHDVYPEGITWQDGHGRMPLHYAARAIASRQNESSGGGGGSNTNDATFVTPTNTATEGAVTTLEEVGSIIVNLLRIYPMAAKITDAAGKLPFHYIAKYGEVWDINVERLYQAYPEALHQRTSDKKLLPIHLVTFNPDANRCLIENIVKYHPRGAMLCNNDGKLPLHLACESGKTWDGGVECIYIAYPKAISVAENNPRHWLPLHFTVQSPNSSLDLITRIINLYPQAAKEVDWKGRTPLHLAVESGKEWDHGLQVLFRAYPESIEIADNQGNIPFVSACLCYCKQSYSSSQEKTCVSSSSSSNKDSDVISSSTVKSTTDFLDSRNSTPNSDASAVSELVHVNNLFQLLYAAPHVLRYYT